jgi:hypothetical protein
MAASRYERLASGDLAGVDVMPGEVASDLLKSLGRESCLRRCQPHRVPLSTRNLYEPGLNHAALARSE